MKWNWDDMFGNDFFIEIKNEERKYFGIEEISPKWTQTTYHSKTNCWYKRVMVFWNENSIVKVIVEEKRVSGDDEITYQNYREYDTEILTENKEWILPMTARGKKKKTSASNILSILPFKCSFYFCIDSSYTPQKAYIVVHNPRSCQNLAIGESEKINKICNNEDFRAFIKEYIDTCPEDYFDRVEQMKNSKHRTVKYCVGDVFRIEVDRFRYCYGIITGEINAIKKWTELPKRHSLQSLMMEPIMIRYYSLVTTEKNLSINDLLQVPLSRVKICGDNDIIWGTHQIIGHKELEVDDLEFNLVCTKGISNKEQITVFTQNSFLPDENIPMPEVFSLDIEWGTAVTSLDSSQVSGKLRTYFKDYQSPHRGVSMSIWPNLLIISDEEKMNHLAYKYNLLEEINRDMRNELFSCIGLNNDATFDEFACKFGGLTKKEILQKII